MRRPVRARVRRQHEVDGRQHLVHALHILDPGVELREHEQDRLQRLARLALREEVDAGVRALHVLAHLLAHLLVGEVRRPGGVRRGQRLGRAQHTILRRGRQRSGLHLCGPRQAAAAPRRVAQPHHGAPRVPQDVALHDLVLRQPLVRLRRLLLRLLHRRPSSSCRGPRRPRVARRAHKLGAVRPVHLPLRRQPRLPLALRRAPRDVAEQQPPHRSAQRAVGHRDAACLRNAVKREAHQRLALEGQRAPVRPEHALEELRLGARRALQPRHLHRHGLRLAEARRGDEAERIGVVLRQQRRVGGIVQAARASRAAPPPAAAAVAQRAAAARPQPEAQRRDGGRARRQHAGGHSVGGVEHRSGQDVVQRIPRDAAAAAAAMAAAPPPLALHHGCGSHGVPVLREAVLLLVVHERERRTFLEAVLALKRRPQRGGRAHVLAHDLVDVAHVAGVVDLVELDQLHAQPDLGRPEVGGQRRQHGRICCCCCCCCCCRRFARLSGGCGGRGRGRWQRRHRGGCRHCCGIGSGRGGSSCSGRRRRCCRRRRVCLRCRHGGRLPLLLDVCHGSRRSFLGRSAVHGGVGTSVGVGVGGRDSRSSSSSSSSGSGSSSRRRISKINARHKTAARLEDARLAAPGRLFRAPVRHGRCELRGLLRLHARYKRLVRLRLLLLLLLLILPSRLWRRRSRRRRRRRSRRRRRNSSSSSSSTRCARRLRRHLRPAPRLLWRLRHWRWRWRWR